MTPRHGGYRASKKDQRKVIDFSANLNPLGPPAWLRSVLSNQVSALAHYPDPECAEFVTAAARRYGVSREEIIVGNGSSELLYLLPRVAGKRSAVISTPCYVDYAKACEISGVKVSEIALREKKGFKLELDRIESELRGDELVFIGQPNNPTGLTCDPKKIRHLARRHPETLFVIDEAFADFVEGLNSLTVNRPDNVLVLLSLTKIFAIPGLRLGCLIGNKKIVQRLREIQPPWSVNAFAQAVGTAALTDRKYLAETRRYVSELRANLVSGLNDLGGLTVYPGQANFLLLRLDRRGLDAVKLAKRLLGDGLAIRVCDNFFGLDKRFFRVAIRTQEENNKLLLSLSIHLKAKSFGRATVTPRTPAIMFQGTSSNAGKSILTAAFCRILFQDGYRVAPFKAQNMSLNSFVTRDGGEMGRAQVVQAQACRLEPDVRMNPVLLKPNSNTGSQVIVCGKPVGNMEVAAYIRYKKEAFKRIKESYHSLARECDVMVLEGAGSPGEVNLKSHDVVNMAMAREANAPVLLVGDIDRGGVYASFVGTMEVLEEWERELVAGYVVNRFRGKQSLLSDAHDYVLRHTHRPVLGVVPFINNLDLPEEDSVTFKEEIEKPAARGSQSVDIALIDLPHISNFTDFDAFKIEPDVRLRVVRTKEELGVPDAVIIPGSKNVIADLDHLRRSGIGQEIIGLAARGTVEIVGICGGYQILGLWVEDRHRIESKKLKTRGLQLLPLTTLMACEKTLVRAEAIHLPSGLPVHGYEIHHGQSASKGGMSFVDREDGLCIGSGREDGRIWGTYLHGIFDADEFRRWFIDGLRTRKGLKPLRKVQAVYDLEPALDRLASVARQSLQVDKIYKFMGLR